MSSRFAMAAHVVAMLAWKQQAGHGAATSDVLAASVNTHPVVVRRLLADLKRAGLVDSRRGAGGGSVLACDPERTTLREIYEAVAEQERLLECAPGTHLTRCEVGGQVRTWLEDVFAEAEEALKARLGQVTVAQMRDEVAARTATAQACCAPDSGASSSASSSTACTAGETAATMPGEPSR